MRLSMRRSMGVSWDFSGSFMGVSWGSMGASWRIMGVSNDSFYQLQVDSSLPPR